MRAASPTRPVVSEGMFSIRTKHALDTASASALRQRLRRWFEDFDPSTPRPADYILGVVVSLLLALCYVGERGHAVQLNKRIYELEERASSLRTEVEVLGVEVTRLADRHRIVTLARKMGMTAPDPAAVQYIYFVRGGARHPRAPRRRRRGRTRADASGR